MSDNKLRVILEAVGGEKFARQIGKANNQLKAFGAEARDVGQKLTIGLSVPIAAAGVKALASAAKFEKLQTQLNVLTGSAEKGTEAFKQLVKFSAGTPFQLDELVQANNTLMGFGVSAEDAFKHLQSIGDIAAVSGGDLQGISVAFGQVAAAGRLMGQDLLQLINNGVPIIDMLSDSMGVAKSEIKDMVSEGAVTFPVLIEAFQKATSEGGKFAGGMAMLSGTLGGVFSTLKDNINIAFAEVGKSIVESFDLINVTKQIITTIQNLTNAFKNLSPKTKKIILVITGLAAALGPVLLALGTLPVILSTIGTAFTLLTGPVGLVLAGLTAIAYIVYREWDEIAPAVLEVYNAFVDLYNGSKLLRGYIGYLGAAFTSVFDVINFAIKNVVNSFTTLSKIIAAVLRGDFKAIGGIIAEGFTKVKETYINTGKQIGNNIVEGIKGGIDTQLEKKTLSSLTGGLKGAVEKAKNALGTGGTGVTGDTGRAAVSTVSAIGVTGVQTTDPVAQLADSVKNSSKELDGALQVSNNILKARGIEQQLIAQENALAVGEIVTSGLQGVAEGIGMALGEAIANGGSLIGALSSTLLTGLANMAIQMGKLVLQNGIAIEAIKESLTKLTGIPAIVAGVALIAIGAAVKAGAANIAKGKGAGGGSTVSGPRTGAIAAFADGGIVSGPTLGLMGEYAGARSNPEVIAPLDRLKNMIGDRQAQQVNVGGQFELRGQDLIVALQRAEKQRGRIK